MYVIILGRSMVCSRVCALHVFGFAFRIGYVFVAASTFMIFEVLNTKHSCSRLFDFDVFIFLGSRNKMNHCWSHI